MCAGAALGGDIVEKGVEDGQVSDMSVILDKDAFYPDPAVNIKCVDSAFEAVRVVVGVLSGEGFEECGPGVFGISDASPEQRDEYLVPLTANLDTDEEVRRPEVLANIPYQLWQLSHHLRCVVHSCYRGGGGGRSN